MRTPSFWALSVSLFFLFGILWFGSSCGRKPKGEEGCKDSLLVTPQGNPITAPANQPTVLKAELHLCKEDPSYYTFSWYKDENRNLRWEEEELKTPVALSPEFPFIACGNETGKHLLRVSATPITQSSSVTEQRSLPTFTKDIFLEVYPSGKRQRPQCVQENLKKIPQMDYVDPFTGLTEIESALSCLEPYVEENICDFPATYLTGVLEVTRFLARFPERFENRSSLTLNQVLHIVNTEIQPVVNILFTLEQKAPDDFSFYFDGLFKVKIFEDLPYLEGDQTFYLVLWGEHDKGDLLAFTAFAQFMRGVAEMTLAYRGLFDFLLQIPRLDQVDSLWLRRHLIETLEENPEFLTIDPKEGKTRLLNARGAFMDALLKLSKAIRFIRAERDPQVDDLLRYWDCGTDGICKCDDPTEIYIACPNSPSSYSAPDEDGSEKNGRYDKGEPLGTDRIMFPEPWVVDLPSDLDWFLTVLDELQKNLLGPEPLDLDRLAGAPPGSVKAFLTGGFNIPYPEVRLSEWFLTPSDPRSLIPLYSRTRKEFLFDTEGEPFQDTGYDGKSSREETILLSENPRSLPAGTPWDPITNPDPHFDDLDGFCNLVCNFNDRIDNDGDGLSDSQDLFVFRGETVPLDLGVEGNLTFDFVDLNGNYIHDCTEPSEPFEDSGVLDFRGNLKGAGNGQWDFADRAHTYPKGADVGPIGDIERRDPPNGSNGNPQEGIPSDTAVRVGVAIPEMRTSPVVTYTGLYDPFYFFFPDPTFSRVLLFPDPVQSVNGELLTENAKLHRFFNKILELLAIFDTSGLGGQNCTNCGIRSGDRKRTGPREGNAHPCSRADLCITAVQKLGYVSTRTCP